MGGFCWRKNIFEPCHRPFAQGRRWELRGSARRAGETFTIPAGSGVVTVFRVRRGDSVRVGGFDVADYRKPANFALPGLKRLGGLEISDWWKPTDEWGKKPLCSTAGTVSI